MLLVLDDYETQGYKLTLRQLYYRLVSKDLIPNNDDSYKRVGKILLNARMGGLIDWGIIEDRLRVPNTVGTWDSPKSILNTAITAYKTDRLKDQEIYLEVWVEKDALSSIVAKASHKYQIPVMVNRGYGSATAMYNAYERIKNKTNRQIDDYQGRKARILYLGDHDPSGLDMIRDVEDRIKNMLSNGNDYYVDDYPLDFNVIPIALTQKQIKQYTPPPNPAKLKDTRSKKYVSKYGYESWEVDALPPNVLESVITKNIENLIDLDKYEVLKDKEELDIEKIRKFINKF